MASLKYNLFLVGIEWQFQFFWKLFIFQVILESSGVTSIYVELDSLVGKNTPQTIAALGYPVESHVIKTADHVLLQYFRIPHGGNSIPGTYRPKPVALLVHGLMSSSYSWLGQDDDKNLPFILAEEGYDVWLANSRGVSYSNRLQSITFKNTSFWQFSWDEMAFFDLPAAIDYILHVTKQRQLFYVGHSQGTTQLFALLSKSPEYNAKIRLMVAMAPVVYLEGVRGLFNFITYVFLLPNYFGLPELLTSLGIGESFPALLLQFSHAVAPVACSVEPVKLFCQSLIYGTFGFDFEQFNPRKWPHMLSRLPDTTSLRTLAHITQMTISTNFPRYNHGPLKNIKKYGTFNPPLYNVSRITAPVALFWGPNDFGIHPKNVARLARELRNLVLNYRVPYNKFTHVDFLIGKDASTLVYTEVLRVMASYR